MTRAHNRLTEPATTPYMDLFLCDVFSLSHCLYKPVYCFSIIFDHFSLNAFILLLTFILCFALCSLVAARSHCYLHLVLFGLDSAHLSTDCLVIEQEGDEVINIYSKNSGTL